LISRAARRSASPMKAWKRVEGMMGSIGLRWRGVEEVSLSLESILEHRVPLWRVWSENRDSCPTGTRFRVGSGAVLDLRQTLWLVGMGLQGAWRALASAGRPCPSSDCLPNPSMEWGLLSAPVGVSPPSRRRGSAPIPPAPGRRRRCTPCRSG
jgi:hypothetical protein